MALTQRSKTAENVAIRRAQHQLRDQPPVLNDPLAVAIVGADTVRHVDAEDAQHPLLGRLFPVLRAGLAVRSRVAEDTLAEAVAEGLTQYVVLGAGLDTFAYRHSHAGLQVFEVDHPETQAWKKERLVLAGIPVPPSVHHVAVDFTRDRLADALQAAGCRLDQPVFFSWLGVTPYLARPDIDATLRFIATCPPGSGVVFDYLVPPSSLGFLPRMAFQAMSRWVAENGEPWVTWLAPASLVVDIQALGYGRVESLGAKHINPIYFAERRDGLRMGSMFEILRAWV